MVRGNRTFTPFGRSAPMRVFSRLCLPLLTKLISGCFAYESIVGNDFSLLFLLEFLLLFGFFGGKLFFFGFLFVLYVCKAN